MEEPTNKTTRTFLRKDSLQYAESAKKKGVIYLSRIPPFMKPNKVRTHFEMYGEVTKLFLSEEEPSKRVIRKSKGGNGSKQFTEGWVEFDDKQIAKSVAESLNGKAIGSKKGDYYHDDVWNIKYLKNFKWDYLTEKLAYERRVRENKLKMAMMQVYYIYYIVCTAVYCVFIVTVYIQAHVLYSYVYTYISRLRKRMQNLSN